MKSIETGIRNKVRYRANVDRSRRRYDRACPLVPARDVTILLMHFIATALGGPRHHS